MDEARTRVRGRFEALASRRGDALPLAETALVVAGEEYPGLDVDAYLAQIDAFADQIREAVDNAPDERAAGSILTTFLHTELGFRGNDGEYYDPRNSFLNEVLERRRGIPITLSILYIEVAQRLGLAVHGIGLPGHFMIQLDGPGTYIDPFSGEVDLRESDCAERAKASAGVTFDRSMLAPQTSRQILIRLLRNLREVYRSSGDEARELAALDRLVLLSPKDGSLLRGRAEVLGKLGRYQLALRDLNRLRQLQPGARRGERFRNWRGFVREMASRMN